MQPHVCHSAQGSNNVKPCARLSYATPFKSYGILGGPPVNMSSGIDVAIFNYAVITSVEPVACAALKCNRIGISVRTKLVSCRRQCLLNHLDVGWFM